MQNILVLGTTGGPTALASGVGTLGALEGLQEVLKVVGVSGVSGWAAPAGAIALKVSYLSALDVLQRADSKVILRLAVANTARWVSSGGKDFFTGFFRGLPIRAFFRLVLGKRKFQDCQIPLAIPALSVEQGKIVTFSQNTHPEVEIARAARASSANPAFEAEAEFDLTKDHYIDPGLTRPLDTSLLDKVEFSRCLILVNDITRAGKLSNFRTGPWSYPRLLYQVIADAYSVNLREQVLETFAKVVDSGRTCQIVKAPGEVPFFEFTGRQLTQFAGVTREKVERYLQNKALTDSI